jgi:hypothetical protein
MYWSAMGKLILNCASSIAKMSQDYKGFFIKSSCKKVVQPVRARAVLALKLVSRPVSGIFLQH